MDCRLLLNIFTIVLDGDNEQIIIRPINPDEKVSDTNGTIAAAYYVDSKSGFILDKKESASDLTEPDTTEPEIKIELEEMDFDNSEETKPTTVKKKTLPAEKRKELVETKTGNKKLEDFIVPCGYCSYTCFSKDILDQHIREQHQKGYFEGKEMTSQPKKRNYKYHATIPQNSQQQQEMRICHVCGKDNFPNNSTLRTHLKQHSKDRYKCEECDFTCSNVFTFKNHVNSHRGKRKHQCTLCEFSSSTATGLKLHVAIHNNVKFHQCQLCSYSCVQGHNLKIHMRSHTGEKPYKCHLCDYASTNNGHLKTHLSKKHSDKKIKCETCESEFATKTDFRKHESGCLNNAGRCLFCSQIFHNLTRHQMMWTTKLKCCCCHNFFNSEDELSQHKETWHECETCKLRYCHERERVYLEHIRGPCFQFTLNKTKQKNVDCISLDIK